MKQKPLSQWFLKKGEIWRFRGELRSIDEVWVQSMLKPMYWRFKLLGRNGFHFLNHKIYVSPNEANQDILGE